MPASPEGFRRHLAVKPRGLGSLHACVFFLSLAFALPAHAATRDYLLEWIPSPSPDVAGYIVYVGDTSGSYGPGMDIGNPSDAKYLLKDLDSSRDHYVAMTAYDYDGLESVLSNEIVIPALLCDATPCNDGNACTVDACSGSSCTNIPVPDGTGCDDGDLATIQDTCSAGACRGVLPECSFDSQCDDGNACTVDRCDAVAGCTFTAAARGTACDDGLFCTVGDTCGKNGVCQGSSPRDCSGVADECTVGQCDESSDTCQPVPGWEGQSCNDGDACTVGEVCTSGFCGGGSPTVGNSYYELAIDGAMHPLYDMSGGYAGADVMGFLIDYDLAMSAAGRLTGSATVTHPLLAAPVPAMVYGSVRSKRGIFSLVLSFRLADPNASGAITQVYSIDPGAGTYALRSSVKARVAGQKIKDRESSTSMPLASLPFVLPDGAWTLILDVVNLGSNRLESNATIQLSSGGEIDFRGAGKLKKGRANVSLRSGKKGGSLSLVLDELGITEAGVRYRALGQGGSATDWTENVRDTCEE